MSKYESLNYLLPARAANVLAFEGVTTVEALVKKSESDLMKLPNFGEKSLNEVRAALSSLGLSLRGEMLNVTRADLDNAIQLFQNAKASFSKSMLLVGEYEIEIDMKVKNHLTKLKKSAAHLRFVRNSFRIADQTRKEVTV